MLVQTHGAAEVIKANKDMPEETLKKLPTFNVAYEAWYSEGLALVKQLLPDRLQDFKEHFEAPKNRKEITYATYRIQDALKGLRLHVRHTMKLSQITRRRFLTSNNKRPY